MAYRAKALLAAKKVQENQAPSIYEPPPPPPGDIYASMIEDAVMEALHVGAAQVDNKGQVRPTSNQR